MAKRFIDGQELTNTAFLGAVGTVSESGGVPTGAIMESGSNANGNYIKYADGTLICMVHTPDIAISGGLSSIYIGTWPVPFTARPIAVITQSYGHGDSNYGLGYGTLNSNNYGQNQGLTNTKYAAQIRVGGTAATVISADIIAIGRWY